MSLLTLFSTGQRLDQARLRNPVAQPGSQTSLVGGVGGALYGAIVSATSSGSSEIDIENRSLPANLLTANGQMLEYTLWGRFAANGNNKRIRGYFGATTSVDTGTITLNNYYWRLLLQIMRTGSGSQLCMSQLIAVPAGGGTPTIYPGLTGAGETMSGGITFRTTMQGGGGSDIEVYFSRLTWWTEGN